MSDQNQQAEKQDTKFKPGVSGNPAGRPKGSRGKLQENFFKRLSEDFQRFGIYAIVRARHMDPLGYVKVCASLMPKEFELTRPLDDLTDEQLDAALATVRALQVAANPGSGKEDQAIVQPTEVVPALPETV